MDLHRETLQKVLEVAAKKGDAGFQEQDITTFFQNNEYDLVFHLDYLTEKGYVKGEFTSGAYAAFALLPKPIHFIRGKITEAGKVYLEQLQRQTATDAESSRLETNSLPPQSDLSEIDVSRIPISPQTNALVEESMPEAKASLKQETKALMETIKKRAQAEVQGAQQITVGTYLAAVRNAKESLEATRLFDPERIEEAVTLIQQDAQNNMQTILDEIAQWGDRLAEAARAAWETLTASSDRQD